MTGGQSSACLPRCADISWCCSKHGGDGDAHVVSLDRCFDCVWCVVCCLCVKDSLSLVHSAHLCLYMFVDHFFRVLQMYQNTEEYWSTIMSERQKNHNCLSNFDRKYLQKWLVREKGRDVDTLNEIEQDSFAAPWRTSSVCIVCMCT